MNRRIRPTAAVAPRARASASQPPVPRRRLAARLAIAAAALASMIGTGPIAAAPAQPAAPQRVPVPVPDPRPDTAYANRADVAAFLAGMVARHGFIESELVQVFAQVRHDESVIRRMSPPPPEFRKSWRSYRERFIDPVRIREGVRFWDENEAWLELARARYGVPPQIVVAIIGVETVYGRVTGDVRVMDALTTLAFDYPRRADYFRSELEQFLLYVRDERLDAFSLRGSYAGAIGLPQFMPGSIRRYAVDLDGDGHVDLRNNAADAIGSVAHFLAEHGWQSGEPIRLRTKLDDEARLSPLIEAGIRPQFTTAQLAAYGVTSAEPVSRDLPLALIDLPNGEGPTSYFLGAQNFYVITRYNRSSFYAMAVHDLSRALADARGNGRR